MQTDWGEGGEYHKLSSFFERIGINYLVSCPHTHQQNGSTERKHRHIVETGLLLAHASMPLKFWDEALLIDYLHMCLTMHLLLPHSLVLILPIYSCVCLVVYVGHIFSHIKLTNFLSDPCNVCFLAIALITKVISA
jgi:hypothetical protein